MRKATSLFLVFSVLLISGNLFAEERRGVDIEIYKITQNIEMKMEGTPWESTVQKGIPPDFRGELIAVKKDSILLLDRYSGADVTVDLREIGVIKIVRKSKALQGIGLGLLIGGVGGALLGLTSNNAESNSPPRITEEEKFVGLLGAVGFGLVFPQKNGHIVKLGLQDSTPKGSYDSTLSVFSGDCRRSRYSQRHNS
jgi:hypothetical protein